MKLLIDIPDNTYNAIMARDWKNAGWLFSDELKAIHDGKPFVEELQEIRHEIETAQTYKIASGSHDLYIDRDNALEIIDSHIEQYKEDAE